MVGRDFTEVILDTDVLYNSRLGAVLVVYVCMSESNLNQVEVKIKTRN